MLNTFSISFWVNQPQWFQSYAPILAYTNSGSKAGWIFDVQDNGSAIHFGISTNNGTIISPNAIPVQNDTYVNIIGTFDGSKISLYRNGKLYDIVPYIGKYNSDPGVKLRLGLESFYNRNSWSGSIDDLRIYNRSLSGGEVMALFNNSSNINNGLVGYWPFDGTLEDKSGNNNHAKFRSQAVSMAFAPDGRLFFTEKRDGEVKIMKDGKVIEEPFLKLAGLYLGDHQGLLGITIDPKFQINKYTLLDCSRP